MAKYKTLIEDIEHVTDREVVKKNRISLTALLLFGVGILCFLGGKSIEDPNSALSTFLYTTAVCLLMGIFVKFFLGKEAYLFKPTGSKLKKTTVYFDSSQRQSLFDSIENRRFESLKQLKRQSNTGVRLDVMFTGNREFVATQLLEYVPYTYETATPAICYYGEDAKKFLENLQQK